jgi:hypothetical protein
VAAGASYIATANEAPNAAIRAASSQRPALPAPLRRRLAMAGADGGARRGARGVIRMCSIQRGDQGRAGRSRAARLGVERGVIRPFS